MPTTLSSIPIPINVYSTPPLTLPEELLRGSLPWDSQRLLEYVRSGQVWLVKGKGPHGLVLEKPHLVELVQFGGAVGMAIDRDCRAVLPIGQVYLQAPATFLERQWGYRRRAYSAEVLQKVTEAYPSQRRAALLWHHLCQSYGPDLLTSVPDEWLGRMVGVAEHRIRSCRQQGGSDLLLALEGLPDHDQGTVEPLQNCGRDITQGESTAAVAPAERRQNYQVKSFRLF